MTIFERNTLTGRNGVPFRWVPWGFRTYPSGKPYGWLRVGDQLTLSWGIGVEYDERLVGALGWLLLTRPETDAECAQREAEELEEQIEQSQWNDYRN